MTKDSESGRAHSSRPPCPTTVVTDPDQQEHLENGLKRRKGEWTKQNPQGDLKKTKKKESD